MDLVMFELFSAEKESSKHTNPNGLLHSPPNIFKLKI